MVEQQQEKNEITVLIVEDHKLTRVGIKAAIERASDISVIGEAENGLDGVARYKDLNPSVVLMDVGMPGMDGIEASAKIKAINDSANIVIVTSHDNEKDVLAALAAGASGYCLKDAEPERLQQAIRAVHCGDAWLDSTIAGIVLRQQLSLETANEKSSFDSPAPAADMPRQDASGAYGYAEPLSPREQEVLALIVEGLSNNEISERLFISLATTKTHVRNILNKLAVNDRTQAAVRAMRQGLV